MDCCSDTFNIQRSMFGADSHSPQKDLKWYRAEAAPQDYEWCLTLQGSLAVALTMGLSLC